MNVIGIDPDCQKSGLAVYKDGKLVSLHNLDFKSFCSAISNFEFGEPGNTLFIVEDATKIKGMYKRNRDNNPQKQAAIAQKVGSVKQLGLCLIDYLELFGFTVIREKPSRKNWAKDRTTFERITGWNKQSNEETRSAAYFGYLYKDRRF